MSDTKMDVGAKLKPGEVLTEQRYFTETVNLSLIHI